MLTDHDPRQLGRYRVLAKIGQGGQGVVFLAEGADGTRVAVKVLRDHGDERARARFHKEVATAQRVAPFCTARILEIGEENGSPYVVTEYIEGPSLRELVGRDGPRSGAELYRLAVGTATALAAIHQAGVVHRDFKPGNVLVGPDGPRVIDFGIARALDLTATATESIIGTPAYMAPEQFSGRDVGPAADVFAWGATIAYAANGRPPHGQDSIPAVMGRLLKGQSDLGRLDGPLYRLVADCLHRDPRRRPDSRELLMRLLERDAPISADQALAQGRDLAGAADATLVDARTAKWTALRTTDRPVRSAGRSRNVLAATGAAVTVAATVMVAVIVANLVDGEASGSGKAGPTATARPTTPAQISAAIQEATTTRRTYALTVEGYNGEGTEGVNAEGRCQIGAELRTDCDLNAGNETGGDQLSRVVLIGDTGYFAASNDPQAYPVGRAEQLDRPGLYYARNARWLASPRHIVELLRHAEGTQTTGDRATVTYRGRIPIQTMAGAEFIGAWYEQFGAVTGHVTFTLATSTDHLPQKLELNIVGTAQNSDVALRANYQVGYKNWGRAGNVAKPF